MSGTLSSIDDGDLMETILRTSVLPEMSRDT